ncbi:MAG: YkgJ family cysteine cluster protein [Phycisphaerales bacterium]|nr:YkgJ family cysteine cluster protein [Phycisphaerales bacterium]
MNAAPRLPAHPDDSNPAIDESRDVPRAADRAAARVRETASAVLRSEGGGVLLPMLDAARVAVREVARAETNSPQAAARACRAGCSWCCYLAVSITPAEALMIADGLLAQRSASDLPRVQERMLATAARVAHLTIEQRARAQVPCALLGEDGACTIHAFRPLGCRGWTSFDAIACETAQKEKKPGHDGPQDALLYAVAGAAGDGLSAALREAGAPAGDYEFHAAVSAALEFMTAEMGGDGGLRGGGRLGGGGEQSAPGRAAGPAGGCTLSAAFAACPRVTSERLRSG